MRRWLPLFVAIFLCPQSVSARELIFADGFESGDVRAWAPSSPSLIEMTPRGWSTERRPTVSATFHSSLKIDTSTVRIRIGERDVTGEALITAEGLSWTPPRDLEDSEYRVTINLSDMHGNQGSARWRFGVDNEPPVAVILEPTGTLIGVARPTISFSLFDRFSQLHEIDFVLRGESGALEADCSVDPPRVDCAPRAPFESGTLRLGLQATDLAGNRSFTESTAVLQEDHAPPSLSLTHPKDGAIFSTPTIAVGGSVTDELSLARVEVDGRPAELAGDTFTGTARLSSGDQTVQVVAVDAAGRRTTRSVTVHLDLTPPTLTLEPLPGVPGAPTNAESVTVRGTAFDDGGVVLVEVAGEAVASGTGAFSATVPLDAGLNSIAVRAVDTVGHETVRHLEVRRWALPGATITSPQDLSTVAATTIDVEGTATPGTVVTVNGMPAEATYGVFRVDDLPLTEGGNLITATATAPSGGRATDTVVVVRDLTPPRLSIYRPQHGALLTSSRVTVAGLVNDIVPGTVNASEVRVSVNGAPAGVRNRSFATDVLLTPGTQRIEIRAVDESGNEVSAFVDVTYQSPAGPRLEIVGGDGQTATIARQLPEPLVVRVLDVAGRPVAGVPVIFSVEQGNGRFPGGAWRHAVVSGDDGTAAALFSVGTRAGRANHVVAVQAVGYGPPVTFSSSAEPGPPATVLADSGGDQTGVAGKPLPRPLVATVTDGGFNRLGGVPVLFRVVKGAGLFPANGLTEIEVLTDSDGRAIVEASLDPQEGPASTVFTAELAAAPEGLPEPPRATFVGSGLAAGDPAATSISGLVLDGSGLPIEGVTVFVRDTALRTRTDANGFFRILPAPVGTVYLLVDGSTAERPGAWPDLEYVVTTVPGRDVDVGTPIHLLPLDLAGGTYVSETVGGTVTMPEVPGFRLEIEPGSVVFPGGGRSGIVSATAVHYDRIPMTPNFGQQPRLIVTIQPAGARFDPPARMILPNVEDLEPGEVTEMYSFDHDLGHFVSIGPASVSRDGAEIVADPGVGILKAGWHCGGNPRPGGTPFKCPPCEECDGTQCVAACTTAPGVAGVFDRASCTKKCPPCRKNCTCEDPFGEPIKLENLEGSCVVVVGEDYDYTVSTDSADEIDWLAPRFTPNFATGSSMFSGTYSSFGDSFVIAQCEAGPRLRKDLYSLVDCEDAPEPIKHSELFETSESCSEGERSDGFKTRGCLRPHVPSLDAGICARGSESCYYLRQIRVDMTYHVVEHEGYTDITGPGDPIDASNCEEVLRSLTPSGEHSKCPDIRVVQTREFVSLESTRIHELEHARQFERLDFVGVAADTFKQKVAELECTECPEPPDLSSIEATAEEVITRLFSDLEPDKCGLEREAYAVQAKFLEGLRAEIRQWITDEHPDWPSACRVAGP